ncbi:MAG TPA: polysaccharide biosynthesis/export family protein [Paludibacter sp.]
MKNRFPKHFLFFVPILLSLLVSSCLNQKKITYFQPKEEAKDTSIKNITQKQTFYLKPGNIINVGVNSISPDANTMFNPFVVMQPVYNTYQQTNNLNPAIGYMVDKDGAISLPLVGKIVVSGLDTKEATDLITEKLGKYLVNPIVNVRMLNYNVSVMGEVERPSVYTIPNERISLPEVLSLAGDLTIFARRDNVLVIRENNGKREFARVDLTKRDLFDSPYYYLQPNDVVYVEPGKGKKATTDRTIQLAPTILSGASLLTVLLSIIFKK